MKKLIQAVLVVFAVGVTCLGEPAFAQESKASPGSKMLANYESSYVEIAKAAAKKIVVEAEWSPEDGAAGVDDDERERLGLVVESVKRPGGTKDLVDQLKGALAPVEVRELENKGAILIRQLRADTSADPFLKPVVVEKFSGTCQELHRLLKEQGIDLWMGYATPIGSPFYPKIDHAILRVEINAFRGTVRELIQHCANATPGIVGCHACYWPESKSYSVNWFPDPDLLVK